MLKSNAKTLKIQRLMKHLLISNFVSNQSFDIQNIHETKETNNHNVSKDQSNRNQMPL